MYSALRHVRHKGEFVEANIASVKVRDRRTGERRENDRDEEFDRRQSVRRSGGYARALIGGLLLIKLGKAAAVLKLLKSFKILEPLIVLVTAVISAGTYSLTMKTTLAFGLVCSLAVHELGHFGATKRLGLRARWFLFIPFVGALMPMPDVRSRNDEAYIAIGGPFVGWVFSSFLFVLWLILPLSKEWGNILFTISLSSCALNLFNLIPLAPIDGGRITQAVHPLFRWVGFLCLLGLSLYFAQASMALVWLLVFGEVRMEPLRRVQLSIVIWLAMPILIVLGFHGGSMIEDWCYFVVGLWPLYIYYRWYKEPPPVENDWRMESLTVLDRTRWGLRYALLLVALCALFALHLPHVAHLSV